MKLLKYTLSFGLVLLIAGRAAFAAPPVQITNSSTQAITLSISEGASGRSCPVSTSNPSGVSTTIVNNKTFYIIPANSNSTHYAYYYSCPSGNGSIVAQGTISGSNPSTAFAFISGQPIKIAGTPGNLTTTDASSGNTFACAAGAPLYYMQNSHWTANQSCSPPAPTPTSSSRIAVAPTTTPAPTPSPGIFSNNSGFSFPLALQITQGCTINSTTNAISCNPIPTNGLISMILSSGSPATSANSTPEFSVPYGKNITIGAGGVVTSNGTITLTSGATPNSVTLPGIPLPISGIVNTNNIATLTWLAIYASNVNCVNATNSNISYGYSCPAGANNLNIYIVFSDSASNSQTEFPFSGGNISVSSNSTQYIVTSGSTTIATINKQPACCSKIPDGGNCFSNWDNGNGSLAPSGSANCKSGYCSQGGSLYGANGYTYTCIRNPNGSSCTNCR